MGYLPQSPHYSTHVWLPQVMQQLLPHQRLEFSCRWLKEEEQQAEAEEEAELAECRKLNKKLLKLLALFARGGKAHYVFIENM